MYQNFQKNNYLENLREGKEREKTKMYVTRPFSLYRKDPTTLSLPPPETCNTGYLVITDEESEQEMEDTCCFGTCHDPEIRKLPFPQNKLLKVVYSSGSGDYRSHRSHRSHLNHRRHRRHQTTSTDKVWFIPVLDQPLSSNRYYVIKATGKHEGQAYTCSKESDMSTCCFCNVVNDVKSRSFDHRSIYQQVEIFKRSHGFTAKSVAPDGFSPTFLSRKGWRANISTSYSCQLGEALGLDVSLRRRLPELNFPMPNNSSTAVVVGKWYCPCVFIKDGSLKDQMKNSMFYEMTLEQHWEQIYAFDNDNTRGNVMVVNMSVQKEAVSLFGKEAVKDDDTSAVDGVIWFRQVNYNGEGLSLGLSAAIVDKMRWLQEEGGWEEGGKRDVMVEKVEEFTGDGGWKRFGCFVLVERFALKRMDGTLLLTCDYRNVQQIQSKWE